MDQRQHREAESVPSDPSGIEQPHDVLAAEEFGIGTRDERYPADPSGIEEPHDVLAAEEFAMPAPGPGPRDPQAGGDPRAWLPLLVVAALLVGVLLRRRRYG